MSKEYYYEMPQYLQETFFKYIKRKSTVVTLTLQALKYMSAYPIVDKQKVGKEFILLKVSKQSRIYFFSANKFFTLTFPFSVSLEQGVIKFKLKHLDYEISYEDIYFIEEFVRTHLNGDIEKYSDLKKVSESDLTPAQAELLISMLLSEDGYMRFDFDQDNANGVYHPLYHLDTFYRDYNKAKFGLYENISPINFVEIFEQDKPCMYLKNYEA